MKFNGVGLLPMRAYLNIQRCVCPSVCVCAPFFLGMSAHHPPLGLPCVHPSHPLMGTSFCPIHPPLGLSFRPIHHPWVCPSVLSTAPGSVRLSYPPTPESVRLSHPSTSGSPSVPSTHTWGCPCVLSTHPLVLPVCPVHSPLGLLSVLSTDT